MCALYQPDPAAHVAALVSVERMSSASRAWTSSAPLNLPANLGNEVQFVGYDLHYAAPNKLALQLAWRVVSEVQGPRNLFVHLLGPDGQIESQWDGLGVAAEGWREGDTFIQRALLTVPQDISPGEYGLEVGMYNPETMQRLPVIEQGQALTDRVLMRLPKK